MNRFISKHRRNNFKRFNYSLGVTVSGERFPLKSLQNPELRSGEFRHKNAYTNKMPRIKIVEFKKKDKKSIDTFEQTLVGNVSENALFNCCFAR